jgi:hypothetical protein
MDAAGSAAEALPPAAKTGAETAADDPEGTALGSAEAEADEAPAEEAAEALEGHGPEGEAPSKPPRRAKKHRRTALGRRLRKKTAVAELTSTKRRGRSACKALSGTKRHHVRGSSDTKEPVKKKTKNKALPLEVDAKPLSAKGKKRKSAQAQHVVTAGGQAGISTPMQAGAAASSGSQDKAPEALYMAVDALPEMVQAMLADERERLSRLQEAAIEAQRRGLALQGRYVQRLFYLESQAARLQAHALSLDSRERVNIEVSEEVVRLLREVQRGVTDIAEARQISQADLEDMSMHFAELVSEYKACGLEQASVPYVQEPDNAALSSWLSQAGLRPREHTGPELEKALKHLHEANTKLQPGQQLDPADIRRINKRVARAMSYLLGEDRPELQDLPSGDEAPHAEAALFSIATPRPDAAAGSA